MTTKEKLLEIIKKLPEDKASQVYDFALFLKQRDQAQRELAELSESPAFRRMAKRSLKEIRYRETLSLDELKKEISRRG